MRIEAIYDNGRLELPANIKLRHSRITLSVVIPDTEIIDDAPPAAAVTSPAGAKAGYSQQIDAILGDFRERLRQAPPLRRDEIEQLRYEALKEKYLAR